MARLGPSLRYESEVQLSVKVTTWVWEHSRSRGPARLVLLAIADNAHDDGAQAWPSMTTIVRKTGLAERTVHRAIKQLIGMDELEVRYNAGPGLCNLYRVRVTPAPQTPPSERHPRQGDTPVRDAGVSQRHPTPVTEAPLPPSERHPEPSIEPSRNRQQNPPYPPVELARPIDNVARVFQTWQKSTGKFRADLTSTRRQAIVKALAAYSVDDVEDAVQGWAVDPWPERAQHNDITQLLHMGTQRKPLNVLEKMRDLWRDGPPRTVGKQTAKAIQISQQMRAMREEVIGGGLGSVERDRGRTQRELPASGD